MTTRPVPQRSTRSLVFPAAITLPVSEDPQLIDEHGYEVFQSGDGQVGGVQIVNADGEEEGPAKVLSVAESLVFLQALRQTRNHHLTSLFPLFPTPRPQPKGKGKSKLKAGGPNDPTTLSAPDPTVTNEQEDQPLPPHVINPIGQCSLSFGPMRFDEVWLWECRFDVQPSKEEEVERKRRIQAEKIKRQQQQDQRRPQQPQSRPTPPTTTRQPTPITPNLIALVNAEARIHPWLNALITRAAQQKATQEELRSLGGVVEKLSKGWRVDGTRISETNVQVVRPNVVGPPVGQAGTSVTQQSQAPKTAPISTSVPRPMASTPIPGKPVQNPQPTIPSHPVVRAPAPAPVTTTSIVPPPVQPPSTQQRPPAVMPSSVAPNRPPVVSGPTAPAPRTSLGNHYPLQTQDKEPGSIITPFPPPLLLLSFAENPSEKFVIPTELAYISYKMMERSKYDVETGIVLGKILISTFMPAVGWPKWTPPAPILQTTTEPQAVGVKVSSVEVDVARVAHKSKPKVKEELKAPPNELPQLDEPFGPVDGVTLPKGFVQPITISLDHVTTQTWATVSRLLAMIEAMKDGGKKLREAREKAEADRQEQERRERAERERVEKEAKEEEERKRKEIEEFEAAEVDKMNKRARRSAVVKPKEVPAMVVEEPRLPEEKAAAEETVEPPVKERTLKERIFQALLERVPPRMFLRYQLPPPLPAELVEAATDRAARETYNAGSKITFGHSTPEVEPTPAPRKRKAPSPAITFEMPMSFEGMEEAIAKSGPKAKRSYPTHKRVKRSVEGKICEGCGNQGLNVWRVGPGGIGTLCNACGDKFKAGVLGELKAPGAAKAYLEKNPIGEEAQEKESGELGTSADGSGPARSATLSIGTQVAPLQQQPRQQEVLLQSTPHRQDNAEPPQHSPHPISAAVHPLPTTGSSLNGNHRNLPQKASDNPSPAPLSNPSSGSLHQHQHQHQHTLSPYQSHPSPHPSSHQNEPLQTQSHTFSPSSLPSPHPHPRPPVSSGVVKRIIPLSSPAPPLDPSPRPSNSSDPSLPHDDPVSKEWEAVTVMNERMSPASTSIG